MRRERRGVRKMWEKYKRLKWHMRRIRKGRVQGSVTLQMVMSVTVRSEGGEFKHKYVWKPEKKNSMIM